MKARNYIFFAVMILVVIHIPFTVTNSSPTTDSSTSHPVSLYKFNAMTDTATNLQLNSVYPLTKGKGVLIGEIDTGVDKMYDSHIFHNNKEVIDGHDDDGNGYIDDVRGWNVLGDNNNTADDSYTYHGTEVASMILQTAPDATILPVKFVDSSNSIVDYTQLLKLNDALDYLSLFHVDVIVMAFNFNVVTPTSVLTRLQNLQNNGTIIVVSAGNCDSASNDCGYIHSPARNSYVYSIGSIASDLSHSDFSAQGPELDFSLFGQDVTVYSPDFPTGTRENGTSFSVAEAAGLMALYKVMFLQKYSVFNLTDFINSLDITAHELGPNTVYGKGIPQLYTAFRTLYDNDYPQLLSYTYSQSFSNLLVNIKVSDQSGIGDCTYTIFDQDSGMNQTCDGLSLLPIVSDGNNQAQYSFYILNISNINNYLQVKLFLTDLNFHTDVYTLQVSITSTPDSTNTSTTFDNSSYIVKSDTQNATQIDSESTIGVFSLSTLTNPKTSPFLEITPFFGILILISFFKRIRSKKS